MTRTTALGVAVGLMALLVAPAGANAKAAKRDRIVPVLECVVVHANGTYTASFGYLNGNASTINLAAGSAANDFSPSPDRRGQPSSFAPGRSERSFTVTVKTSVRLTWSLDGTKVEASRYSRPCVISGRTTGNRVRTFWTERGWEQDRWGLKAWLDIPCTPLARRQLKVEWNRHGEAPRTFVLSNISWVFCWNDPFVASGSPEAAFDSSLGVGVGLLDGQPAAIEWLFTDRGERSGHRHAGRGIDRAGFVIRDWRNRIVLSQDNLTLEGNVQAQR